MIDPLKNFKNPWEADGEYAQKLLNIDHILDRKSVLKSNSNITTDINIDTLILQGFSVIEGNTGSILHLGNAESEVRVLSLQKISSPILKKEGSNMNREEFLDRCHWVYGECGGVEEGIYYAFAIENLSRASGFIEGVTRFNTEEELKVLAWKDNTHSYSSGTIKTASQPYVEFNNARNLASNNQIKDTLNNNNYFRQTIKNVIWAHYGWQEDPTLGAYQWAGGEQAIINSFSNSIFEPYDFVNVIFSKSGGSFSQTFYKFRKK